MVVTTEYADISLPGSPMRTFVAALSAEGQYPGIWCYCDIFQLTPPKLRFCVRLAGIVPFSALPLQHFSSRILVHSIRPHEPSPARFGESQLRRDIGRCMFKLASGR
jgi:hypothetical protein